MKLKNFDLTETVNKIRRQLEEENISSSLKSLIEILLFIVVQMTERLSLNSKNSSKPPSSDINRNKKKKGKPKRKPGGQPGRVGTQLKPVNDPDEVKIIKINKKNLPKDSYTDGGYETRQVMDFIISTNITEYRAEVLINSKGKRYVADFPSFVKRPIQYGPKIKANSVYMSQFQLIPYARIQDYFSEQIGINLSPGSIFNFNQEAYEVLSMFEKAAKENLINSHCINVDETSININGKRLWLHTACNDKWTYFYPHQKRGSEAMDEINILPQFKGVLCHDHWKAYYKYKCKHSLCNSHHLRELEWCATEDKQKWAEKMRVFLTKLNGKVISAGGKLSSQQSTYYHRRYKKLLEEGDQECPSPDPKKGKRGRVKKSKSRNLLERLMNFRYDVLRFMDDAEVPFTNNQGENDLRMTKVQQKISGCFRSEEGAYIFCRIRAYLITCRKHGVGATEALEGLFSGKLPNFIKHRF